MVKISHKSISFQTQYYKNILYSQNWLSNVINLFVITEYNHQFKDRSRALFEISTETLHILRKKQIH